MYLSTLISEYLHSSKDKMSTFNLKAKTNFYNDTLLPILGDKELTKITYSDLERFKDTLTRLPKRNIQRYRLLEWKDLMKSLDDVLPTERISTTTINKYIKHTRSLLSYAVLHEYIQVNYANRLPTIPTTDARTQRLPLSEDEIRVLLDALPEKMKYLTLFLALTGVRLSELYKGKIREIDNILCFDLTGADLKLKTRGSYRVIPLHSSLLSNLGSLGADLKDISSDNLAKTISRIIKVNGMEDSNKKSLYSLRHYFATTLIQRGADANIVSQLMGHSAKGQTLSRYSSGYTTTQLLQTINILGEIL